MNVIKPFLVRSIVSLLVTIPLALFVRSYAGASTLLTDINGVGWLVGVLGTIYTFVAAFTVVEVWSQFNGVTALIAKEAKAVTSIWNYVDYLNDTKVDKKMQKVLVAYLLQAEGEKVDAASGVRSPHPSIELMQIFHVMDTIRFDDKRDVTVFPLLVAAYEELSSVRSERIGAGTARIPSPLRIFFTILSVLLLSTFILLGFVSTSLYIYNIALVTIIISYAHTLILDLDNPFVGIWNVDYTAFVQTKKYILETRHNK
ncbi:hypothetical protein COT87_01000 [Candidatus Collierbacteria bacterium CG10_big_fil_rev_8_21_14_0_10_44_9]|uniref:DUF4239 domain-containing protein n=1 Tax=Candidatus Collierbacteria bacterium CG10_big_fil_rev_8_21_14_0_10_44_9 TaxID=1974535 RepID=A0A2H0VJ73_9BACT|nr:MAG: hypothetical protein COT87_01000 [Candidatus Collierbacteria bacterium CG10_big_fil_rev_8_21_14_0_10_44_9]